MQALFTEFAEREIQRNMDLAKDKSILREEEWHLTKTGTHFYHLESLSGIVSKEDLRHFPCTTTVKELSDPNRTEARMGYNLSFYIQGDEPMLQVSVNTSMEHSPLLEAIWEAKREKLWKAMQPQMQILTDLINSREERFKSADIFFDQLRSEIRPQGVPAEKRSSFCSTILEAEAILDQSWDTLVRHPQSSESGFCSKFQIGQDGYIVLVERKNYDFTHVYRMTIYREQTQDEAATERIQDNQREAELGQIHPKLKELLDRKREESRLFSWNLRKRLNAELGAWAKDQTAESIFFQDDLKSLLPSNSPMPSWSQTDLELLERYHQLRYNFEPTYNMESPLDIYLPDLLADVQHDLSHSTGFPIQLHERSLMVGDCMKSLFEFSH